MTLIYVGAPFASGPFPRVKEEMALSCPLWRPSNVPAPAALCARPPKGSFSRVSHVNLAHSIEQARTVFSARGQGPPAWEDRLVADFISSLPCDFILLFPRSHTRVPILITQETMATILQGNRPHTRRCSCWEEYAGPGPHSGDVLPPGDDS